MVKTSDDLPFLSYLLVGMAAGAALMYFMDPAQGRRRRAMLKDKAYSASAYTRNAREARTHDLNSRALDVRVEASRMLH